MAFTKRDAQVKHTRRRAQQRYGIDLDEMAQRRIVALIQARGCPVLRRQSLRVVLHAVEFEGVTLPVLYDKKRKSIITVLPEDALYEQGR